MSIIDATTGISYTSVSAAILGSNSGDTIDVSAGSYVEDFPKIFHNLTIQGVGGVASFSTPGTPVNGQAILVVDATVTLQNWPCRALRCRMGTERGSGSKRVT